jgi:hypothetical protein
MVKRKKIKSGNCQQKKSVEYNTNRIVEGGVKKIGTC